MKIVRYNHNGVSALYIDGELAVYGDYEEVLEHLVEVLEISDRNGDEFLGGTHAPLETVEEVNAYTKRKMDQKIEELRQQISTLERESAMLGEG